MAALNLKASPVLLAGCAAAIVAAVWLYRRGIGGMAEDVGGAAVDMFAGVLKGVDAALPEVIRPSSDNNIVYQASSIPAKIINGNPSATYGTFAYDFTHTNGQPNNAVVSWWDSILIN